MREWSGLDWAAFIALWITVALSAADQALRLMPELSASIRPHFERTPFFMSIAVAFAPILLLTFATGVFLVDAIWPPRESVPQTPSTKTAASESIESALASAQKKLEDTRVERDQFQQQLVSMQAASQQQSADAKNRIGPEAAISIANELAFSGVVTTMPKTFVVVTAATGNEIFEHDITTILNQARGMSAAKSNLLPIGLPNYQKDIDAPRLEGRGIAGITIHGRNDAGNFLMQVFSNCFLTHQSGDTPETLMEYYHRSIQSADIKDIVWIEIGKGPPWLRGPCNN